MHLTPRSDVARTPPPLFADDAAASERDAIELGEYRPGDERAVLDCMAACFDRAPDAANWRHLYFANPAGEPIIALARAGEDVIGHLALLPRRLRVCGRTLLVAHQVDGMTHPRWRRRGLRKRLAQHARRCALRRGLGVTYGVSNEQSTHTVLTHEGRTALGAVPLLLRPVRPLTAALAALRERIDGSGTGTGPGAHADVVDCAAAGLPRDDGRLAAVARDSGWQSPRFDARHTALFADAADLPAIGFLRDAAHLSWRYTGRVASPYLQRDARAPGGALAATAIIRALPLRELRLVFLLEWHWRAGAHRDARGLVGEAVALARASGAHAVAALAMPGTPQRRALRWLGFVPIPPSLVPRTSIVSVRVDVDTQPGAPWFVPSHWHLTAGDGLIL